MRVTVKTTACPWCCGELVVESDGSITCVDNCACHSETLTFHEETMALIQPVIDYQKQIADGDRQ